MGTGSPYGPASLFDTIVQERVWLAQEWLRNQGVNSRGAFEFLVYATVVMVTINPKPQTLNPKPCRTPVCRTWAYRPLRRPAGFSTLPPGGSTGQSYLNYSKPHKVGNRTKAK